MSETVDHDLSQAPVVTDPNAALASVMKTLLEPMQQQLKDLAEGNKNLAEENRILREEIQNRDATPNHLISGADFRPNPDAARSVVISTRPVRDNPDQYIASGKGVVDPGGLSINDSSPLSGKNR